jgi:hypothetical protein
MSSITYLKIIIDRLKTQKAGFTNNATAWVGQTESPATTQVHIDELELLDDEISALKIKLKQKLSAARKLALQKNNVAIAQEFKIKGIHADTKEKWAAYGVAKPAAKIKGSKPVPTKGIIKKIINDLDGEGFIIKANTLKDAYTYEFEKGFSENASNIYVPALTHFRTSLVTKITDNAVEKGVRYFYRCRGVNAKGAGEWGEAVSCVQ